MIKYFAVIGLLAAAAPNGCDRMPNSKVEEQAATESNQQRLIKETPLPTLQTSLERKNLAERLQRINQQNMTGCIYLVNYGSVMAFYPVRGKVTSLNSYLTGQEQIINDPYGSMDAGGQLMESPDLDGAYGKNSDGIFFFTADSDAYVEWHGDYLWSDQCLKLNQQPLMMREIKD